jgi:hypothetical protein
MNGCRVTGERAAKDGSVSTNFGGNAVKCKWRIDGIQCFGIASIGMLTTITDSLVFLTKVVEDCLVSCYCGVGTPEEQLSGSLKEIVTKIYFRFIKSRGLTTVCIVW